MSRTRVVSSRGLALAIVILGFVLRVHDLGAKSLWYDELRQVEVAQKPLAEWDSALLMHAARPVDYLISGAVLGFSRSEWVLRFPALMWGTLTIPFVYRLGVRLFGASEGLLGAYLFALSTLAISFSQELRPYALYGLVSAVSYWALEEGLKHGRRRAWAMYAATLVVGVFTHYFWLAIWLGQAAYVGLALARGWFSRRRGLPFTLSSGAALVALLIHPGPRVLFPLAADLGEALLYRVGLGPPSGVAHTSPGFNPFAPTLTYDFFVGRVLEQLGAGGGVALFLLNGLLLIGVAGSVSGVVGSRSAPPVLRRGVPTESPISVLQSPPQGVRPLLFALTWLLVGPLFLIAYLMYRNEIFAMRYVLFALPAYLLLVARGLAFASASFWGREAGWARVMPALVFLFLLTLLDARYVAAYYRTPKDDWRRIGRFLEANVRPGDAIVAPNAQAFVEFYFPGAKKHLVYSDTKRDAQVAYGQHERTWFVVTNWVTYDIGDTKRLIELYPGVTFRWDESAYVKFTHRGLSEAEMQAEAAHFVVPPPSLK